MARIGLVLLLFGPAAQYSSERAEALWQTALGNQDVAVLPSDTRDPARPLQHASGEAGDDRDQSLQRAYGTPAVCPTDTCLAFLLLSDGCERLPNPPDFLLARLRAPPQA